MPSSDLLALMQAGDLLALDVFAREHSHRLMAIARKQCHRATDAEDAVQQALLLASTSMTGIRGDGEPIAWLSTLINRTCFRLNAQAARTEELGADARCSCDDPEEQAERRELGARLGEALMTLQRTDRLMFLLSAEGFDGVELAERFGLSHDAIRSRLKRTRQRLRILLERDTLGEAASTEGHDQPSPAARHR